jgi:hypothetical protein
LDIAVSHHVAIKPIQVEYVMTQAHNSPAIREMFKITCVTQLASSFGSARSERLQSEASLLTVKANSDESREIKFAFSAAHRLRYCPAETGTRDDNLRGQ